MFKRKGLLFSDKDYSMGGLISLSFAIVSVAALCYGIYLSFLERGQGSVVVGNLGFFSLLFAFFGLIFGLLGYREKDKKYTFSFIGSLSCGIILVMLIFFVIMNI